MLEKTRNNIITARRRTASALDLMRVLKRPVSLKKLKAEAPELCGDIKLPAQEPKFLGDIPAVGTIYHPQQPVTVKLKQIIEANYYTEAFESAIKKVSSQHIPELSQIKTLYQYYYYIDALVTWIPEIRVWCWNGDTMHERTCYLRITQFYYYFNQTELVALQSPIVPDEGARLSPISNWMREFAVDWGNYLDTKASCRYLKSFKYAPEYAWQDYEKPPEDYDSFNAFFWPYISGYRRTATCSTGD